MMSAQFEFRGNKYNLKEPSIQLWNRLMSIKDWTDETEFSVKLLAELCDLTEEQIKQKPWDEIMELSKSLSNYILQDAKKFYKEFEFQGQKYRFIDVANLTFGEFIDIDTFLSRPANERLKDTNLLMAMFYREVGLGDKILPYDSSKLEERANKFKELPVKYVNGSSSFFFLLGKELRRSSLTYSSKWKRVIKILWIMMTSPRLVLFGVGLIRSHNSRMKTLQKLKQSLITR